MIRLSICIPTYNRAQYLPELLESIVSQAPQDGSVELCISDNASLDNTREIIDSFRVQFPYITYFCQDQNLGFDRNMLKAVDLASGEFVWLMGSDDAVSPAAISQVLTFLCHYSRVDGVSLTFENFDLELKTKLVSVRFPFRPTEDITRDVASKVKFFYSRIGYISIVIFRRHLWVSYLERVKDRIDYFCYGYVHVYILCGGILQKINSEWGYISTPHVKCRAGNDGYSQDAFPTDRILLDVALSKIDGEIFRDRPTLLKWARLSILMTSFMKDHVIRCKLRGCSLGSVLTIMWAYTRAYYSLSYYWIHIFGLFFIPAFMMKIVRWGYRHTLKKYRLKTLHGSC